MTAKSKAQQIKEQQERDYAALQSAVRNNHRLLSLMAEKNWRACDISVLSSNAYNRYDISVPPYMIRALLPELLKQNKASIKKMGKKLGLCDEA